MHRDSYYTPKILSDKLVSYINKKSVRFVADFCVGDGELLRSASDKWKNVKCYGTDISQTAIDETFSKHPNWVLEAVDFLDDSSQKKSKVLSGQKKYDLILLNPPFSYIGGVSNEVVFESVTYKVSTAMKFLTESLRYLTPDGFIYAILPSSTAYSQKDRKLWLVLEKRFNLSILEEPNSNYFKGATPNIILISINDFSCISKNRQLSKISFKIPPVKILRGKLSMNLLPSLVGEYYLVHTTNIKNQSLFNLSIKVNHDTSKVIGPAILLSRVGNPKSMKICLIDSSETYVLSDCLLAIQTKNQKDASNLFRYFIDNLDLLSSLYKGTGARYITIDRLKYFLDLDIKTNHCALFSTLDSIEDSINEVALI
ncbi:methyltransferase [Mucilaginibacter sp. PAMB04274]|uniref:methyltransferase n=1 Tax=Mucilaginibacter sp. PAMB04274 TaxID=3138568 RepID=UPI0031F62FCC